MVNIKQGYRWRGYINALLSTIVVILIGKWLCKAILIFGNYYTYGIVNNVELSSGERNISFNIYIVQYKVNSNVYVKSFTYNQELSIGDTVEIRYSNIFPDVSEISQSTSLLKISR